MQQIFAGLEKLSHVFGVVATVVGLPTVLFGAYVFSGEIIDRVTPPDVVLSAPRMTLRCFTRVNDQATLNDIRQGVPGRRAEVCGESNLSVGFLATIDNQDRLPRTITNVTARLTLPDVVFSEMPDQVDFDLSWAVTDEVHGIVITNVRRGFKHIDLPPQTTIREEIWIDQSGPFAERVTWDPVRAWLRERAEPGQVVKTEIYVQVAGIAEPMLAQTCAFVLTQQALDTYRGFPVVGQRAFTAACP